MALTYRQLLWQAAFLARQIGRDTAAHRKMATLLQEHAADTHRVAEMIASLNVDDATVAETREVGQLMAGIVEAATAYATAADTAAQHATAVQQQATTDHAGIQEAADRSPVPMADRRWYTQE